MSISWDYILSRLVKRIWFPSLCYGLFGIIVALSGLVVKDFIPESAVIKVGSDSVDSILRILASSMLGVTTFALATMVAAYGNASSSATPRATRLLLEDKTAQHALATFVGAFLYSIVGIIALTVEVYGAPGRFVLFVSTIIVIIVIVVNLMRTIAHLSTLGLMGETIFRIENATENALKRYYDNRKSDCKTKFVFPVESKVLAKRTGYVVQINMNKLIALCKEHDLKIRVLCAPGKFLFRGTVVAECSEVLTPDVQSIIRSCIYVERERIFENDPRFGFIVLSEIASRALSAAVNDPGTAIAVIGAGTRLLTAWSDLRHSPDKSCFAGVEFLEQKEICAEDVFEDFFEPIYRDGAGMIEVIIRLLKSLGAVARIDPELSDVCALHARRALEFAADRLPLAEDSKRLREIWSAETKTD